MSRARRLGVALALALALARCGAEPPRVASLPPSELPGARPTTPRGAALRPGTATRAVLGDRRAQVLALFHTLYQRLAARDAAGAAALFDDEALELGTGQVRSRDGVAGALERALAQLDTSLLQQQLATLRGLVRSPAEARARGGNAARLRAEDWFVELVPFAASPARGLLPLLPRELGVRWSDGEPRFVAVTLPPRDR